MLCPLDVDAVARLAREAGLDFVALFGSHARSQARPESDVDLALMPASYDVQPDAAELSFVRGLQRGDLDFVWLPHANWLVAWQVAQHGHVLYESRPGTFRQFCLAATLRRADSKIWDRRNQDFVQRVLERNSTLNRNLINAKLASMARYLVELEDFLRASEGEFLADVKTQRACERQTEMLVECAASINNEVGQAVAQVPSSDYYSSFFSLVNAGWLGREMASRLADVAGLRNRLVHPYEPIDSTKLYRALASSVGDWRTYVASVREKLAE